MVQGAQIEVARLVVGTGGGLALVISLEEEEFRLWTYVEGIKAHLLRPFQSPLEDVPGVAHEGFSVRVMDVTDEPGYPAVAGPPGEDGEGVQVGVQVLIRLVDADKTLDGGAVEHDLVIHRLLNLRCGDGHVLELTENVGELKADELHILFFYHTDDVFLAVRHAGHSSHSFK